MPERSSRRLRVGWLALAVLGGVLGGVLCGRPALAHKLNVFGYAEGKTIHGEAYLRGGAPVRDAPVAVFDAEGNRLAEVTTDAEGKFSFDATLRCDHRLVVDAGAGHSAEFTVPADELPDDLPADQGGEQPAAVPPEARPTPQPQPDAPEEPPGETKPAGPVAGTARPANGDESLEARVAALSRQIVQLRKQLDDYEQTTRWHDVLGGIGYILGIMGVAFYFLGVRRKETRAGDSVGSDPD